MASPAFGKHDLTPSSKTSNFQSKKKRFRASEEAEAVESGDDYCIIDISDGNVKISVTVHPFCLCKSAKLF